MEGKKFFMLMVLLIVSVLAYPWLLVRPVLGLLSNIVLLATGMYVVSGSKRQLAGMAFIGLFHIISLSFWVQYQGVPALLLASGSLALFYGIMLVIIFKHVVDAPYVDRDTIFGAVSIYLLMGFFWSALYCMVLAVQPDALSAPPTSQGPDFMYFSFVTLCTIGYGDYTPREGILRPLAILEGTMGLFYMAVLVSRLVSLFGVRKEEGESASTTGETSRRSRENEGAPG